MINHYKFNQDTYNYILRMSKMYWSAKWMNHNPGDLLLYDIKTQERIDRDEKEYTSIGLKSGVKRDERNA